MVIYPLMHLAAASFKLVPGSAGTREHPATVKDAHAPGPWMD